ncbi:glutamine synthetase beta-grasp domain-containing protein, partial [Thermodesulfobacteriota bacterium]
MANFDDIRRKLEEIDSTKIFFTDLNGRIMSLHINPENIDSIISNGIGFDGSSVAGYATVDASDRLLFPDPDSFQIIEFSNEKIGFFIGRIYNDPGIRAQTDPRAALENVLK